MRTYTVIVNQYDSTEVLRWNSRFERESDNRRELLKGLDEEFPVEAGYTLTVIESIVFRVPS